MAGKKKRLREKYSMYGFAPQMAAAASAASGPRLELRTPSSSCTWVTVAKGLGPSPTVFPDVAEGS